MNEKKKATLAAPDNSDCKDTQKSEKSYLEQRLSELGITDEENRIKVLKYPDWRFFTDDGKGNIRINYLALDGQPFTYMDRGKEIEFARTRFQSPKDPKHKYDQPKGTETFPFFTPTILGKYKKKETIKTLFVTEGEFKAFKLSMLGVPCVGIGGVQNFKSASKDRLHPDLIKLLEDCHVENVVLLFDRDCLETKWEDGKDLAQRPNNFFSALNTFNELLKPYDKQLYFSHISLNCKEKGIDDLLCSLDNDNVEKCLEELLSLLVGAKNRRYIETYQITGISSAKIKAIFGLDSVQAFYELHKEELENRDFIYTGKPYYIENGKAVLSWGGAEKNFILVGNDYYQKVVDKSPFGDDEINLYKREKGIIKARYGNKFVNSAIPTYDGFANIPENDPDKYRQDIISEKSGIKSRLYNIYRPLEWKPIEGEWPTIEKFLHHIFDYPNTQGKPMFDFILDWLQIIYTNPTQPLPCICLVSRERETGKSTFLEFTHLIFSENFRVLDSERIGSRFNESWAGKLVIGVDESLIDPENKGIVANTLKTLITNKTINSEGKGTANKPIANIAKLIMCSNDETNFIKIESEENRYAIVKVGTIQEKDPDFLSKMKAEIPAFLFYLKNRELHHERKDRLWFDPKEFETEALRKIQERTAPMLERHIKGVIREQFEYSGKETLKFPYSFIKERVSIRYNRADTEKIKDWLHDHGYKVGNPNTYTYYDESGKEYSSKEFPSNDKPRLYTFHRADFITQPESKGK